uniref:Uncharacterized protein n=1 Tax=Magallana gigas TaxID=29159 RepID=A0A8W8MDZ5_MAGGI
MVDKADISWTLPGKNGHFKSKSYKNEGTFKRKKNLKRSQNIDIVFVRNLNQTRQTKVVRFVADGSGYASLQTTPNRKVKSVTPDQRNKAGKSENPEKDDSLHIDETPVKEYDVDNISTLWPALSGEVDVSTSRTVISPASPPGVTSPTVVICPQSSLKSKI